MADGAAGEPSAKRAKVDEADEEEDPIVRRKEEVVRLLKEARSREDARAERVARRELVTLCADFEAKNEKLLRRLLPELWQKILDENVQQNDLLAFAMTCRFFREKQKDLGKKVVMVTNVNMCRLHKLLETGKVTPHTLGWFQWVCDNWEIRPGFRRMPSWRYKSVKGAVYKGDLVNYAAFRGSVEILRWLMEEKGWELNEETGKWAGLGGSVKVLEYMREKGYKFNKMACNWAVRGEHLEALKYLRGLDPPCPWDEGTCGWAALEGRLEVLKCVRSQDPPCPWDEWTCAVAAEKGHLEVLKWLRSQDPPCPWDLETCSYAARGGHLEVLKFLRAQDPPCPWDEKSCSIAACWGHLEVLKWARSQDPPCPWSAGTSNCAARNGHLDILKWARSEDPPCPWSAGTCSDAAINGHLEVLKWLRAQDPPCPWSRHWCREEALLNGHQHFVDWIDQQEDESDLEDWGYSENDSDM
ncbi:putative ankyrin repeat protein [Chloropicon roscoffensis]|uniref:Ankyrin repeat protein n=1 Tax=Chloropicon roscoffensis TaxID=1461544 RepID=A0AAX4PJ90_9CHLO